MVARRCFHKTHRKKAIIGIIFMPKSYMQRVKSKKIKTKNLKIRKTKRRMAQKVVFRQYVRVVFRSSQQFVGFSEPFFTHFWLFLAIFSSFSPFFLAFLPFLWSICLLLAVSTPIYCLTDANQPSIFGVCGLSNALFSNSKLSVTRIGHFICIFNPLGRVRWIQPSKYRYAFPLV